MNEFPKRSKASISKQTKQHILQAFNKIKEITHGEIRKVQNCRSSGGCFFGKFKSKIKLAKCCRGFSPRSVYKILNEGQGQGLWETLASMTYP
jgi:hypothetical protein